MKVPKTKYIVVSGGVISGIGKGVIASSTGFLLKSCGFNVTAIKIDPYLNIDAGTMNPIEHGEVFVLDDGGEVDLDLGNYERFLDTTLTRDHNITTGKIYNRVIQRERRGDFLGATVQVIPHVTNEVMDWVKVVSTTPNENDEIPDICIIELGGTVGDIESAPFIEAMRQFQFVVGHENFALLHVSLVPAVGSIGEQKTKPTQSSIRDLRGLGLTPDFIMCRSAKPLEESIKRKISMFCHVSPSHVIAVHDLPSMYHVPLLLEKQGLISLLSKRLDLPSTTPLPSETPLMRKWMALAQRTERLHDKVTIGIVGKYNELHDAYASILKSLEHAALACNRKLVIQWINASDLEPESQEKNPIDYFSAWQSLCSIDGLLVPGGFGQRGTEGKISAISYARKNNMPFLGICLGMQLAIVEFARSVLGWKDANSTEFDEKSKHPVVINMPEISTKQLGGTMRLGARTTRFMVPDSNIGKLYGSEYISERHRHRYEVNTEYLKDFEAQGMKFVGHDDSHERMEIIELAKHKYFVGCQFHPEYKTRPLRPSPPFLGLILASIGELEQHLSNDSSEFYIPLSVEERSLEEAGEIREILEKVSVDDQN